MPHVVGCGDRVISTRRITCGGLRGPIETATRARPRHPRYLLTEPQRVPVGESRRSKARPLTTESIDVQAVGVDRLDAVRTLFAAQRATRHCWCMAFCSTGRKFAAGWYGGGNRRRFEAMIGSGTHPMGVLASIAGVPAGWCACGPRSRYVAAIDGRSALLTDLARAEDDCVWLIACLVVAPAHRGTDIVMALLRRAVALAGEQGARAVEAWPLAAGVRDPALSHVGTEPVFARLGFTPLAEPTAGRVVMRLEFDASRIGRAVHA